MLNIALFFALLHSLHCYFTVTFAALLSGESKGQRCVLDMPAATGAENDGLVEKLAADAIVGHQRLAQRYVSSAQDPESLSSEGASIWIQTGLALTLFAFADTRYSVDWAIAWAMIGEWTNHQLLPPPKSGEWHQSPHSC